MRQLVVRVVVEMELHEVAFAHAHERAGHVSAEPPECILDAIGQPCRVFLYLDLDDDLRGYRSRDSRRYLRRVRENGFLLARDSYGGRDLVGRRRDGAA